MQFNTSYLYTLICKKASFDTLRKAEEVIALQDVKYYLEENCVGYAISRYEAWQKAFPEGIDSVQTPMTIEDVCRIPDNDFCIMPHIYANVLQTLCADSYEPEEGEITAQSELHYMAARSHATWIWQNDSSYESFDSAYTNFMNASWIEEFLENMSIPWPFTPIWHLTNSAYTDIQGELIWPSQSNLKGQIPAIPVSPELAPYDNEMAPDVPALEYEFPVSESSPRVRDAERFWPFMRCKNVYKAYGGKGRLSHHELLIWLSKKFNMSVEALKKTCPYTLNAPGYTQI
jgi:hypothetical protein